MLVPSPHLIEWRLFDVGFVTKHGVVSFRRLEEKEIGSCPELVACTQR